MPPPTNAFLSPSVCLHLPQRVSAARKRGVTEASAQPRPLPAGFRPPLALPGLLAGPQLGDHWTAPLPIPPWAASTHHPVRPAGPALVLKARWKWPRPRATADPGRRMSTWSWSPGSPDSQGPASQAGPWGCFFPDAAWFLLKRRNRLKEPLSSSARRCPVVRGSPSALCPPALAGWPAAPPPPPGAVGTPAASAVAPPPWQLFRACVSLRGRGRADGSGS